MIPKVLNTNEVKSRAGVEVEFQQIDDTGRKLLFSKVGAVPNADELLTVSHQSTGSGVKEVRRSMCRVDIESAGVDGSTITTSAHLVLTVPIGNSANYDLAKESLARLGSFVFLTGADSTFIYAGTGTGADSLINGTK